MPKNKVIAIKHGTDKCYKEAFANLETSEVEDRPWKDGPTNDFYNGGHDKPRVGGGDKQYADNYERIFGHE